MTEIEKEAKRLEKLMPVSKAWNRLRLLRFPCFEPYEGDHETKNALPKMAMRDIGKNGWPCSVCKLHSSTECGLNQVLNLQWAIFKTKIKDGKVTCQMCGKTSKISDCDYDEGGPIWCPHCGNRTGSFYLKQVNSAEDELENRRVK